MWHGTPLEVVGDNHSPAPIYMGSGILWCLTGTWCCECLLHLAYVLAIRMCVWCLTGTWSYVCVGYMFVCVVLDRHLVCLVLAGCTVAICEVGRLART